MAFQINHLKGFACFRVTRTNIHTVAAAKAIHNAYLHTEMHTLHGSRCFHLACLAVEAFHLLLIHNERSDASVRTYISTPITLYTVICFPNGHKSTYATFLELTGTGLPNAVFNTHKGGNRQQVAVLRVDGTYQVLNEIGVARLYSQRGIGNGEIAPCGVNIQFLILTAAVNGCIVLLHHIFTLLAVGLVDEVFHLFHRFLYRDNACDAEESRLQNGVGTVTESNLLRNLRCVDVIDVDMVIRKVFLDSVRQIATQLFAIPNGIEQESAIVLQSACDIIHVEVCLYVASHEVRRCHQIGGTNGFITKTQVRAGETAGFLRVVREVSLTIFVGSVTDNFYRVLVGTNCTVCTQSVEFGLEHTLSAHSYFFSHRQAQEGYIVIDTDREMVFRHRQGEVLINGQHLCGCRIVTTQTIASAYNEQVLTSHLVQSGFYIQIERFAIGTGFFGAVEDADTFDGLGQCLFQIFQAERTIEMNIDHTQFVSFCGFVVNDLFQALADRSHSDDDILGIGCSVIGEGTIFASGDSTDFIHIIGHHVCHSIVITVRGLTVCEEHIGILVQSACVRVHRRHSAIAERLQSLHIHQRTKVFHINSLYLLILMRCTETVKEIEERYAGLDGGKMCHTRQIHYFLYGTFRQHGKSGLPTCHHILMVTEDTEHMAGQRACRYMKDGRKQFSCNLIHVRNHQQQAL